VTAHGEVVLTENGVDWHSLRPSRKRIIQGVLGMLLAIVLVVWWLPKIAHTTWSAVFETLSHVGFGSVVMLFGLMCLGLWCYTFTLAGSLPGLRHVQALIVNLCGSSAGNFLPAGGAAGVAVSYAAFRSWGFSRRAISTSVIVTGVWNIFARMILPVTALIALLVAGGGLPVAVIRGGLVGAAAGLALLALFIAALASEGVTRSIGRALNQVLRLLHRWIAPLHEVAADEFITDQRVRMVSVVRRGWFKMTFGLVGYFGVFYVLFWQSMHVVGIRMTFSHMFAAYAVGRLLSAIGLTPGGVGVTEGGAVAVLIAFGADPALALSGTVLFSLYTHVMEVPLGILAYLGWALSKKTAPTDGVPHPGDVSPREHSPGGVAPSV
jgi:putative heme transporter